MWYFYLILLCDDEKIKIISYFGWMFFVNRFEFKF